MNFVNYKFQPSFYDKQSFYDRLSLKLFHDHEARIQPLTTYRIQALAIFTKLLVLSLIKVMLFGLALLFLNVDQCSFYFLKVAYYNKSITAQRLPLFGLWIICSSTQLLAQHVKGLLRYLQVFEPVSFFYIYWGGFNLCD